MEAPVESTGGPEYEPLPLLIPCILCNRKFLPESLVRHKKACEKVLMKKRKQFNSAKQRLTGELAECLPLPPAKFKRPSPARKSSRWKEKHLELLETLRAARVGLAKGSQAAPLLSKPADHEQCPHCGRSFGPKAFDRHEEYCREKYARLEHHRPSVSLQAKERLEARTKYRAPCVKSRRSITREKYLPSNKREPSPSSIGGTTNSSAPAPVVTRVESKPVLSKQNSLSNTKENDAKAASTTGSHFVRASRNSSSFRSSQRRPSQTKPNPQPLAPKPAVNNQRNTEPIIRQTLQALPTNMKIKKDISSREDGYDPFASAEKQMKELLSFSLKAERIEPPPLSVKPILLKALPLPYHDSNSPLISSELDDSQNRSIDSVLSKSGSLNSLDQSIASLENFLDQSSSMVDTSSIDHILDQLNGNAETQGNLAMSPSPVKATRTKSVDYATQTKAASGATDYVRSKSVTSPSDPSLAAVAVNFEQLQKSVAHSKESLSNSVTRSRESLSNKSVNQSRESLTKSMTHSRESLSNKSASSGSKRSTLNSPDLLDRPGSRTQVHSSVNFPDNVSDSHFDHLSHASHETGRKSSLSVHDEKIPVNGKHPNNEGSTNNSNGKCLSPFDQMRRGSATTPASLETILGRKSSLDDFSSAELLSRLSGKSSRNSSRKSSVCSDCSQIMSRKNSSAGFLPDIARCGAKETSCSRDCERNMNRGSNTSILSMSSGEDAGLHGRMVRSAGGREPLRRSTSLFEPPERHPARSKSRGKISCDESTLPKLDVNRNQDRPVAALDDLDLVEAELLQSVSEFEKIFDLSSSSSLYSSPYANSTMHEEPHFGGKVHSGAGGGCKASGDSAYNSLNRKTDHTSSASSSGSESSIPKPSKFCHECGTQYPLLSAKFCCQCGVRRLCLV